MNANETDEVFADRLDEYLFMKSGLRFRIKGLGLRDVGRVRRKCPESEKDQLRTGQGRVKHGQGRVRNKSREQDGTNKGWERERVSDEPSCLFLTRPALVPNLCA